jgi:hypothetical protein
MFGKEGDRRGEVSGACRFWVSMDGCSMQEESN